MMRRHNANSLAAPWRPIGPTGLSPRRLPTSVLGWIYDAVNRAAWPAVGLSALLFSYGVLYTFPQARLAAVQQERDAIDRENRAFCEKHGMPFATREHTLCAEDLMDIRANERRRALEELGII